MSTLPLIQQNIARYGLSILIILGNFGNLFTVLILVQSAKRRTNSCALYLLSASISNWIVVDTALISNVVGVDHIDPQNTSNIVCKIRWSAVHGLLMLSRSFMVAACIDRWALCSQNTIIRSFARPKVAIRMILILLVVWTLIPIHMAIFFSNSTGRCLPMAGTYSFFYAIYSLIVIGILPLFLMILFSLLAWHNLRKIRSRVNPSGSTTRNITINKRDRNLMLMLTGEVIVYCITTIPYPINQIYNVITNSLGVAKNSTRLAIESLVGYIISPFLNLMYCCVQFYVYAVCCRRFRKKFLNLFDRSPRTNRTTVEIVRHTTHVT